MGRIVPKRARTGRAPLARRFHILEGWALAVVAVVIVLFFVASSLNNKALRSGSFAAVVSATLVDLANQDRSANGLPRLAVSPALVTAAQAKADDEAAHGYFAHVSPDGRPWWHWFSAANYRFAYAGENLAIDFSDSYDVQKAWMNSPLHRQNILDPRFTEIGIATATGTYQGRSTVFVVQLFGTPEASGETSAPPVQAKKVAIEKPTSTKHSPASRVTVPGSTLGVATSEEAAVTEPPVSWWSRIIVSPRTTLQYGYAILALCIISALLFTTGFEFHARHRRKAFAAIGLLILMCALFFTGTFFVFDSPTVETSVSFE